MRMIGNVESRMCYPHDSHELSVKRDKERRRRRREKEGYVCRQELVVLISIYAWLMLIKYGTVNTCNVNTCNVWLGIEANLIGEISTSYFLAGEKN